MALVVPGERDLEELVKCWEVVRLWAWLASGAASISALLLVRRFEERLLRELFE